MDVVATAVEHSERLARFLQSITNTSVAAHRQTSSMNAPLSDMKRQMRQKKLKISRFASSALFFSDQCRKMVERGRSQCRLRRKFCSAVEWCAYLKRRKQLQRRARPTCRRRRQQRMTGLNRGKLHPLCKCVATSIPAADGVSSTIHSEGTAAKGWVWLPSHKSSSGRLTYRRRCLRLEQRVVHASAFSTAVLTRDRETSQVPLAVPQRRSAKIHRVLQRWIQGLFEPHRSFSPHLSPPASLLMDLSFYCAYRVDVSLLAELPASLYFFYSDSQESNTECVTVLDGVSGSSSRSGGSLTGSVLHGHMRAASSSAKTVTCSLIQHVDEAEGDGRDAHTVLLLSAAPVHFPARLSGRVRLLSCWSPCSLQEEMVSQFEWWHSPSVQVTEVLREVQQRVITSPYARVMAFPSVPSLSKKCVTRIVLLHSLRVETPPHLAVHHPLVIQKVHFTEARRFFSLLLSKSRPSNTSTDEGRCGYRDGVKTIGIEDRTVLLHALNLPAFPADYREVPHWIPLRCSYRVCVRTVRGLSGSRPPLPSSHSTRGCRLLEVREERDERGSTMVSLHARGIVTSRGQFMIRLGSAVAFVLCCQRVEPQAKLILCSAEVAERWLLASSGIGKDSIRTGSKRPLKRSRTGEDETPLLGLLDPALCSCVELIVPW